MKRIFMVVFSTVLWFGSAGTPEAAETVLNRFQIDSAFLERTGQMQQLKFNRGENGIQLYDMKLVEDDAPAIGKPEGASDQSWFEKLSRGIVIRKELILDDPRAFSGYLIFCGKEALNNKEPLHVRLNGVEFLRPASRYMAPFARHYYTRDWTGEADFDSWFFVPLPVGALSKGTNQILLWTESKEPSWQIMVAAEAEFSKGSTTRLHHPDRSAKSRDGGGSWNSNRLGWKDDWDGEYCVRLSLDRFVPEGSYISPVIDLIDGNGTDDVKKLVTLDECRIRWEVDVPDGCQATVLSRIGRSSVPGSPGWSDYAEADRFERKDRNPPGRYLQFKMVMKSSNPLKTPTLRGLTVASGCTPAPRGGPFYRVQEFRNHRVIRPSLPFTHEDFAKLKDIRRRFALDKIVTGANSEFEAQMRLMRWAYEIPIKGLDPYNWSFDDLPVLKKDRKGNIEYDRKFQSKGRRRTGHCLNCNLTLMAACLAMGYPCRWVNIETRSTYGHEVVEVWSNDFNKWVFMDATRDYYIFDPDSGIPLNLVEINDRLQEIIPRTCDWEFPIRWQVPDEAQANRVAVAYREGKNAFSIRDLNQGPHLLLLKGQLSMCLRNDFASRHKPVPWRLSSTWGGDQFCSYYQGKFPPKREYDLHTDRRQAFNFPLNQTQMTVSETAQGGILDADFDTETPCFQDFQVRLDDGAWRKNAAQTFRWILHDGLNRLGVRVRNTAGVTGPESSVSVLQND